MNPTLFRCELDGDLVRYKDLSNHVGHKLKYAYKCSFYEFLKYHYWRLTKQL